MTRKQTNILLWDMFELITAGMDHGEKAAHAGFIMAAVMAHCKPKAGTSDEGFLTDAIPHLAEQAREIRKHLELQQRSEEQRHRSEQD